jgi:Protein of unknown function DUF262
VTDYLKTTHHTIAWLKSRFDDDELDLAPVFQRNPVWTESQKAFLMDSVIRGMPIPEIYMQEVVDEDGTEKHVVVDGQQRMRACLEFLEGEFPLSSTKTPEYPDMSFEELPASVRKQIFGYTFLTRVLPDMPREEIRAVFTRLNRNVVALNAQELRHATYWGPFIHQMEDLADDEFWGRSGVFSANDVRRMLDVEFVSELSIAIIHGLQNKKASLEHWYEVYEAEYDERSRISRAFKLVLNEIDVVLPNLANTRWSKKSDFYSLFLVLADQQANLPLGRAGRETARRKLLQLGDQVDEFLADPEAKVAKASKTYAASVERAATDLANRRARAGVLEKVLKPVWTN